AQRSLFLFFFQAEDGIRDFHVTGVQTCALPIFIPVVPDLPRLRLQALHTADAGEAFRLAAVGDARGAFNIAADPVLDPAELAGLLVDRTVRAHARVGRGALVVAPLPHPTPPTPLP